MRVDCCCGREIKLDESGEWDHVDGSGKLCWPGKALPDGAWVAEPSDRNLLDDADDEVLG